ncbi:replication factor A protein 3 [Dendrothele bispora CBS 962.96]|uniref:Replication factor A protein 3 n=1 Tax=Dendrothele bispora (strain CBS 962.96) TaxID=1314807 RepID=A0A4S8MUT3_DENBC|nr:replication factor A protein 3 [Dendrothele bispora CBS 962.96]
MSEDNISPRVNSSLMPKFVGQHVRLACKVLSTTDTTAKVLCSDGGEVVVKFTGGDSGISATYVEIIGKVVDPSTIQKACCINLGPELDMQLVDKTIQLIHEPKYFKNIFS